MFGISEQKLDCLQLIYQKFMMTQTSMVSNSADFETGADKVSNSYAVIYFSHFCDLFYFKGSLYMHSVRLT
jgi:hypothetical protein